MHVCSDNTVRRVCPGESDRVSNWYGKPYYAGAGPNVGFFFSGNVKSTLEKLKDDDDDDVKLFALEALSSN